MSESLPSRRTRADRFLEKKGYGFLSGFFSPESVHQCLALLPSQPNVRQILEKMPALRQHVSPLHALASELSGEPVRLCRSILFDKVLGANWKVGWHQDVSLACPDKFDFPGWGPWTTKEGVLHVQPPTAVLASMLTLRLHLDDCGRANGPLRVLPGTHRSRLSVAELKEAVQRIAPEECLARAGDVLAMRPLLVHASSASSEPAHRRVLHLEYAPIRVLPWVEGSVRFDGEGL